MIGKNDFDDLNVPVEVAARRLLGCILEREIDGQTVRVRIVETEAYDQSDVASHSYKGKTARTSAMFECAGHLYVYFTYGMHYCCNIVVGEKDHGAAVLIRAAEPVVGQELLEQRRHKQGVETTNGPAKLCQALGIDRVLNGHDLHTAPLKLIMMPPLTEGIVTTTRVGISQAMDVPWRFYIKNNPYISKQ